ncbi:SRPBCC family protein [Tunturiibacter gelidoferens]|uniref:Uncharacterized protein YndB with AHSA1/START domain n=1 Tax=Tunturiibacter gelidiferens TaxID=3069689 RepID=A0ACC5P3E1_9BACT|nr:SRPBCC domain-containing protein [Edaphobacter lichenicola]MBB5341317.1 uncharacterized protein YndB with AHSA1/START domain [Edaphobacter lichenicola]
MNTATVSEDAIVQEVTIKAPAEKIFRALTQPEELLKWWRSKGRFQAVEAECDLRPGGRWRMRVGGSCGSGKSSLVSGVYREVDPPRLLVYTWNREGEEWPETEVRWDLEEKDGLTTVRLTHSGLTNEGLRERNGGWPLILSLLEAYLADAV